MAVCGDYVITGCKNGDLTIYYEGKKFHIEAHLDEVTAIVAS